MWISLRISDSEPVIEPSGGASGQASDIAIHAREILRVREVLTGIYQRHCGKPDEDVKDGLARFGPLQAYYSILSSWFDPLCQTEKALERDYFLTGELASDICGMMHLLTCTRLAKEALDFGLVDGILEKRPTPETDRWTLY